MLYKMELIFFFIYLEEINWECTQIGIIDNLMLTALYIKVNKIFDFSD